MKTLQQVGILHDCTVRIASTCPVEHIARIREEEAILARVHYLLTLESMGSVFREPGNIIHKIENVLIGSHLLEARTGMTPQK